MPSAPRAERRGRRRVVLGLATVALTAITALPICDAVFDCGCTWPLLGADAHCDVQHPGPPDCPVCTKPAVGAAFSAALTAAWAAAVWGGAGIWGRLRRPGA
jgi:hypothetical protein